LPDPERSDSLAPIVQTDRVSEMIDAPQRAGAVDPKDEFRSRFKQAWRHNRGRSSAGDFARIFFNVLHEAPVPTKAAGELFVELRNWTNAPHDSANLRR
jgi:hypothetical protein